MAEESKHKFEEEIENRVIGIVYDSELKTASSNQEEEISEYEDIIDLLEMRRTEKNYDWMSDIFIPEFPSIILTDAGGWANQYFQSRGFVDVVLEDGSEEGMAKCRAGKKLLNGILNRKDLYHYQKYIRARTINALAGRSFAVCWWDRETDLEPDGEEDQPTGKDQFGNPVDDISLSMTEKRPKFKEVIKKDGFNYEVLDPANIFMDEKYVYSIQDKDWIIIRSEKSYWELLPLEGSFGYINLSVLKDADRGESAETETSKSSYNKDKGADAPDKTPISRWDIYERYGKFWVVTDEDGNDSPGLDDTGEPVEGAQFVESVIGVAVNGDNKILIRFQRQMNRMPDGTAYRPIVRGLCYIHPRKDCGLSDGKYLKELQIAINDTFNMAADRTKLVTMPTLLGRKYALQDNDTLYFEPEHIIQVEDPATDIVPLKFSDDTRGAMEQIGMLTNKGQQVSSVYPTTMGNLPAESSQTATAVAGSESRANLRSNYKSLTFEFTFLCDFYNMIQYMAYQFATPETLVSLMGEEDAPNFDPTPHYSYIPVSSNIEVEASKDRKIQRYDAMISRLAPFAQNPKIYKTVNFILAQMFQLQGNEFQLFGKMLLDETPPPPEEGVAQGGAGGPGLQGQPASNQAGVPQSPQEQGARESITRMMGGNSG